MVARVGRKVGSQVKLTPFARKIYPRWAGKTGTITGREVLVKGRGLMPSAYRHTPYTVSYHVRFSGENRDYFLGAEYLTKA